MLMPGDMFSCKEELHLWSSVHIDYRDTTGMGSSYRGRVTRGTLCLVVATDSECGYYLLASTLQMGWSDFGNGNKELDHHVFTCT